MPRKELQAWRDMVSAYTDTLIIQYGPKPESLEYIQKCIAALPRHYTRTSKPDIDDSKAKSITFTSPNLELRFIPFHPQLTELVKQCKLVISHAGTGSIVDVLRCNIPLIIVTNSLLMNNHQLEASDEFSVRHNYCLSCQDCELPQHKLEQLIKDEKWQHLDQLPPPNGAIVGHILYDEMGLPGPEN
ncbi:N-acetylglucosaminyldiphosphodolichol N-acetylglucosaminyltransferase catalytic subunit alg13 [Scheffersomyces spartinae]|uniref:UDP-N-acetylglucosamine transferase subunit ALG13 n=1 Tax=Scheffersomyces spartinae TaxID=45513 RepID=A0A9P8AHE0_9ASCO|nr:N-acetylglucosaminyldiphosphodolichol N-acetylglucosaminyltransferase catalytic subunit alg13 [Scheffersomyces spartinae]KAG7193242.1 N-acetylglucosaminyldiphosphodolichol N-acetylglucosaminyltransferase catalytic subunit alg13 [Scheffersomyces spartinae]